MQITKHRLLQETAGLYHYHRVGQDERELELSTRSRRLLTGCMVKVRTYASATFSAVTSTATLN